MKMHAAAGPWLSFSVCNQIIRFSYLFKYGEVKAFSPLRIIAPSPPLDFCKNYLYEGIDLRGVTSQRACPGFFWVKDNRGPSLPPTPIIFAKINLYEGIDLETWNLACDTLVPPLVQEKWEIAPSPPPPCHFWQNLEKFYIEIFGQKDSR